MFAKYIYPSRPHVPTQHRASLSSAWLKPQTPSSGEWSSRAICPSCHGTLITPPLPLSVENELFSPHEGRQVVPLSCKPWPALCPIDGQSLRAFLEPKQHQAPLFGRSRLALSRYPRRGPCQFVLSCILPISLHFFYEIHWHPDLRQRRSEEAKRVKIEVKPYLPVAASPVHNSAAS